MFLKNNICDIFNIYIYIFFFSFWCRWGTPSSISSGSFAVETGATLEWDCASILEMKSPVWTTLYTAASPKSQIYQHFSANNHTPVNPSGISEIFNKGILPLHCKEVSQSLYLQHAEDPKTQFHRAFGGRLAVAKRPPLSSSKKRPCRQWILSIYIYIYIYISIYIYIHIYIYIYLYIYIDIYIYR